MTNHRPASPVRRARVFALGLLVLTHAACGDDADDTGRRGRGIDSSDVPAPIAGITVPDFDASAAFELIERQVGFGPRVAGSPGHAAQLEWMTDYLRERADTLIRQPFTHETAAGGELRMTNLFARFEPAATGPGGAGVADGALTGSAADGAAASAGERGRILLLAHWDTRSIAEYDPDPARRDEPILGANDGASGVALLLQIADLLARQAPPVGVDILLVDGEDYRPNEMYLGARHFAARPPVPGYRPRYGILVDMIADQNPVFPIEPHSAQYAPDVIRRVYGLARQLGYLEAFPERMAAQPILDDHIPLNEAGIPTIDIIDFDFGPGNVLWHTHGDGLAAVSVRGLEAVGTVLTELIYRGG